tara:strand:- start:883 stop:1848 length:966 start_codon:yes stop_codon:yes gene_type:complete
VAEKYMLSTITNAITSVFSNKAAKDAIINAAITKVAGGSDRAAIATGLGTFSSQEYGIPGIPDFPGTPPINPNAPDVRDAYDLTAANSIKIAIDAAREKGDLEQVAVLQQELKKYEKPKTPEFIKNIGDYFGFGGLEDLKEKYLDKDSAFRTPLGEGLPSPSGLALPALLGYMAYDSAKDRKGGIALTPQVMMDSLGRYQLASDMGTGGTRAEFGLGPKPSVLNVAGGGEINRQYFSEGGIAELDMRDGGESAGPGTGTSDDIPAMLSDGEYVMTAKATRGAGAFDLSKSDSGITLVKTDNPDRERGVANMRELMNIFEEI